MDKKSLWRKFMKTGKVSDYLNYKNASQNVDSLPIYDDEFSEEFAEEVFGGQSDEGYDHDY
ncbi:MAG: hypothetical protein NC110_07645 [Ruminococcus sp.]|nr:hypothetical protein [Ruminococcus sp.]